MINILKIEKYKMHKFFLYSLIATLFLNCGDDKKTLSTLEENYETAINLKGENRTKDANKMLHEIIESDEASKELKIQSIFAIAQLYYDVKDYPRAIEYFKKLLPENKENDYRKKSLFMIGYIYNNHLDMYTDATTYYKYFLEDYISDELVPSVEYELEQIEEIISKIKP